MSAKQRASRNGRPLKKGELSETANFVTRTQAVKRLQVSLRDFRRLCIFKGIYPRQPPKTPKGSATTQTYYHVKDIGFLAHEPVMHKFREMKAFMKKVRRAAGKGQVSEARRLAAGRPVYRIDHLIRERYPRFVDALADIDDALCMVHLFANLPADKPIEAERIATATRLVREWQHIVVRSRALRKCFISVKGFYYQASFLGVPVTWTAPHRFSLPIPDDVDCRILLTFLELYEVQLKFVMFKLYGDHGLAYPPRLDAEADELGVMLSAVRSSRVDASAVAAAGAAASAEDAGSDDEAEEDDDGEEDEAEDLEVEGGGKRGRRAGAIDASETDKRAANIARAGLGAVLREAAATGGMDGVSVMKGGTAGSSSSSSSSRAEDDEDSIAGSVDSLGSDEALDDDEVEAMAGVMDAEQDRNEEDEEDDASAGSGGATAAAAEAAAERRRAAALRERRGRRLFKGLTFFLNREVPREPFEFVVRAFAGRLGWEGAGSPIQADDPSITHHVIDRPTVRSRIAGRVYVQPQWVFDSSNNRLLLPTERYAPGASLPPHLSPFVEDEQEGYVPDYRKELMKLKSAVEVREDGDVAAAAAAIAAESDEDGDEEGTGAEGPEDDGSDDDDEEDSDGNEDDEDQEAAVALAKSGFLAEAEAGEDGDGDEDEELEGDSSDEDEAEGEAAPAKPAQKDKKKLAKPSSASSSSASERGTSKAAKARARRENARSKAAKQDKKEQDSLEMRAMLLSNRKRKELSLVMRGQRKSKQWQRKMEAKRDNIAAKAEATTKGGKRARE